MTGGEDPEAQRRLDAARLEALEASLARAQPRTAPPSQLGGAVDQANLAWRMVIELVAGLMIGFGIGFGLDWLFGTRPILLVVFVLAGMWAGVRTMMRTARELGAAPPGGAAAAMPDYDDDDDDKDDAHKGQ